MYHMVAVGEKYRHYKSTGGEDYTYEIVHIGFFQGEEAYDESEVVIYKPLYTIDDLAPHISVLVRPRAEFEGSVEYNGQTIQRFTLIS